MRWHWLTETGCKVHAKKEPRHTAGAQCLARSFATRHLLREVKQGSQASRQILSGRSDASRLFPHTPVALIVGPLSAADARSPTPRRSRHPWSSMTIRPADIRPDAFASAPPTKANIPQFSHRFDLGAIVVSPQALRALQRFGTAPSTLVQRHASGDWGDIDTDARQANERALHSGGWLISMYVLRSPIGAHSHRQTLCVVTEASGKFTTLQVLSEDLQEPS